MRVGAEPDIEAVVLRASSLLYMQELVTLDRARLHVDEVDPENRVVYRFVTDSGSEIASVVGFVVDADRLERVHLPWAVARASKLLAEDVRDNLIVRVADETGRVVIATNDGAGQTDLLEGHFDFLFRDWNLSARSRHTAAAQVLESGAFTSWVLTVLMSVAVLGGVLRTWRAASREQRLARIRNAFVANVSTNFARRSRRYRCSGVSAPGARCVAGQGRRVRRTNRARERPPGAPHRQRTGLRPDRVGGNALSLRRRDD